MLSYLSIKNLAVVKELEFDLHPGLTCFTGETGAGKSVIIDSLSLALGARIDKSVILKESESAEIVVIFELTDHSLAKRWLEKYDLVSDNECLIRRTISPDGGRIKNTINGYPCTGQMLRELGAMLVNVHGQHENQLLVNYEYQRELLDSFAQANHLTRQVEFNYDSLVGVKRELAELEGATSDHQSKLDYLEYQLQELSSFDLSLSALEELRQQHKLFSNQAQLTKNFQVALEEISEGNHNIIGRLCAVKNILARSKELGGTLGNAEEALGEAIIQLEEVVTGLQHGAGSLEVDLANQDKVFERLERLHELARKHRVAVEDLRQLQLDFKKQQETLISKDVLIDELKDKIKVLEDRYLVVAKELSIKRQAAAEQLSKQVTDQMHLLGMAVGKFKASLIPAANYSRSGLERVEFLVSTNPGQPLLPLNKVASGGEISRLSLAIWVIGLDKDVVSTVVFDEVDTGIGGKVADMVGQLLRDLGQKTQVICITHLPQIAAKAKNHLLVEKISSEVEVKVKVINLGKQERIAEISRMLGGSEITKKTLAHAREMLGSVFG